MSGAENEAEGKTDQLKGKVQEGVGKVTNDDELQAHGQANQTSGKVQEGIGHLQDAAKDILGKKE